MQRLIYILRKELRQVWRDPRMRVVIFIMPMMQLFLMGFAITTNVKDITTAVLDYDNSPASRELVSRFAANDYFKIVEYTRNEARATELLDSGRVRCVLRFNAGFGGELALGQGAPLQLLVDGTDSNTSSIVISYASRIINGYSQEQQVLRLKRTGEQPPGGVLIETRALYNPNLKSSDYFVPGLFAMILTIISVLLTALAIVRESETGTIEQIMVTPLKPLEYIFGKTVPFALIGLIVVSLMLLLARLIFQVPFLGSPLVFYAGALMFLFSTLSIGLLISTISSNQQQALLGAFVFLMIASLLSGLMFPINNMPEPVQWLTLLNPLRYILVVIRGVMQKGVGLAVLWPQFVGMAALGVAFTGLAVLRFRKTSA